ncbi:MAG TPA: tetratricopeptide repeat protein, partial [Longimicrobiales bacterium]|nr:tetratricopeptide repeat protein [Longimicrobiales bacterium]
TVGPCLLAGVSPFKIVLIALGAFLIGLFVPVMISEKTGNAAASIYGTKGSSTPAPAQYSLADSLVARGKYDDAEEAYTLLSEDFPDDPEPRVRLARLLRDKSARHADAAEWFKRALSSKTEPAVEVAVLRELIEVYTHKLHTPEKALPYLSRVFEKHPTHPASVWARNEYQEIKQDMQQSHNG